VPYLVAVSLSARMCNTVIFIIPATSHKRYAFTLPGLEVRTFLVYVKLLSLILPLFLANVNFSNPMMFQALKRKVREGIGRSVRY